MTQITVQLTLPQQLVLSDEELAAVSGRTQRAKQLEWFVANGWTHALSANGGILVGCLYAHLRLAGLDPAIGRLGDQDLARAAGFDLSRVR